LPLESLLGMGDAGAVEIELAPEHVHRALFYLKMLSEQRQAPDKGNLEQFAVARMPRLAWRRSIQETVALSVQNALSSPVRGDSVTDYLE
jgi:hypothetical protein